MCLWICFWIYGEFSVSFSAAAFAIPTNFHFYFLHLWSIAPLSLLLRSRASQDARCGQDGTVSFGTNGFIASQAFDALQLLMRIRCGVRQVLRSCHSVIIKRRRRSEFFFPSTFLSYLPVLYGSQGKFERICAFSWVRQCNEFSFFKLRLSLSRRIFIYLFCTSAYKQARLIFFCHFSSFSFWIISTDLVKCRQKLFCGAPWLFSYSELDDSRVTWYSLDLACAACNRRLRMCAFFVPLNDTEK